MSDRDLILSDLVDAATVLFNAADHLWLELPDPVDEDGRAQRLCLVETLQRIRQDLSTLIVDLKEMPDFSGAARD